MRRIMKNCLKKTTAILLSAIIVLSVFAMLPSDLFMVNASNEVLFETRLESTFNDNSDFSLDDEAGAEIIPGNDENANDTNEEYKERLSVIQKIIMIIINFINKILGLA